MSTETKPTTDTRTLAERYFDARTLQGLEEAKRGEGYSREEAYARMEAFLKEQRQT